MSKTIKDIIHLRRAGYNTRVTQSIQQYGTGAMVDFPDQTLMTAAPWFWKNNVTKIYDTRLQKALGVNYFGMPGTNADNSATSEGVSYVTFPEYYFCPVCRRLKRRSEWLEEHKKYAPESIKDQDPYMIKSPKCYKDRCALVASGIITVCENGHISDFPWDEWVHYKNINKAVRNEKCGKSDLIFTTGNASKEGTAGLKVVCRTCKATATLQEAFQPGIFKQLVEERGLEDFYCKGYHPWKGTRQTCGCYPETKQRGDSNVYFSCTVSSIVLPTNVEADENKVSESVNYKHIKLILDDCDSEEERSEVINKKIEKWSGKIAEETNISKSKVLKVLNKLLCENEETNNKYNLDNLEYKYEEFNALCGKNNIKGSKDFLIEEMDIKKYNIPGVSQVVLVKKLKEIQVLVGYSRLQPTSVFDMDDPHFVSIKQQDDDWYPGFEIRGEGIFIQFDIEQLQKWADKSFVIKRKEILLNNYEKSTMNGRIHECLDSSYILLHTLSHLLIKQLSYECGYNIASLRERIYYMPEKDLDTKMAGILIYTASGDSEGTLGGLVRQGREDCFPRIFREAIEHAQLCSNDPICITSKGQGRESLNLAACHACELIPETSCEVFNILLDRGMVIGTFEEPYGGFYNEWING
ncbi:protein of unknown function [Lachnospiraceae bacterium KH1T2]|nr:protein of unknown function [Lachnospiraceae bacterium KH1T2]